MCAWGGKGGRCPSNPLSCVWSLTPLCGLRVGGQGEGVRGGVGGEGGVGGAGMEARAGVKGYFC